MNTFHFSYFEVINNPPLFVYVLIAIDHRIPLSMYVINLVVTATIALNLFQNRKIILPCHPSYIYYCIQHLLLYEITCYVMHMHYAININNSIGIRHFHCHVFSKSNVSSNFAALLMNLCHIINYSTATT